MSGRECKRLSAGKSKISLSKSAEGDDEAFDHDTRKPKLTKQGAVDIIKQLRDFLRENGPSEEHELRKALSISEVQMILDIDGMITAFLGRSPLFEIIYEDLHTFVYYNCTDDEDDRLAETFTEFLNEGIHQDGFAGDDVRQEKSVLSSDDSVGVSAGGGEDNEPAACRRKNASSQILSRRQHHSRALQECAGNHDVKITQFNHRPNAIPESQARQPQHIDEKIRTVERTTPPQDLVPPRTAAKLNNVSTSKKDRRSQGTHEPGAQASARESKPRPFSNASPPHQPKSEQKPLVLPVRQLPSFMSLIRRLSPPRHRQMFEMEHGFSNAPRLRPRLTPRRRHPPLPPKSEKSHARPTQSTTQPVYTQRRSTRFKAQERPCSIPIGQNTLLMPQPRPRFPPESRKKTLKNFRPFPAIPRPQPAPRRCRRLPPLPPMTGEKRRGPPITSTTQPLPSSHQECPASRRKAEKKQRALPIASTSLPVPPLHQKSPAHRPKAEERLISATTHEKSVLRPPPHRRSPSKSRQKTQENNHTFQSNGAPGQRQRGVKHRYRFHTRPKRSHEYSPLGQHPGHCFRHIGNRPHLDRRKRKNNIRFPSARNQGAFLRVTRF
ncbi:hypothetical protein HPB51_013288 [Rhipicephalus microplus]|uniref:Uncharacterized protein n=1 Tax=Rhipicephalus microplus TaxID=6941 RepID=A0A9J6EH91_RHIMP|nr:hypothetical protein HPB51_013288 [Rhipicephalus microplus]